MDYVGRDALVSARQPNLAGHLLCLIGTVFLGGIGAAPALAQPTPDIPGDGTYRVGVDVLPGTYTTKGGRGLDSCTWFRHATQGVRTDDIIETGASPGQQVVTIAPTDATFETNLCQIWSPAADANVAHTPTTQAGQTPSDLPGLQQATNGQPCTNTKTFIFGVAPDGQTLACLPSMPPSYGLSAPVIGVRPLAASCTERGRLAQSTDGEPMMCIGEPATWVVYRDF